MTDSLNKNGVPVALLDIKTDGPPAITPRPGDRPIQVRQAGRPVVDQPSVVYMTSPAPKTSGWKKAGRAFSIARGLVLVLQVASYVPGGLTVLGAIGAGLAVLGGYNMTKGPDTEAGRAVARAAGTAEGEAPRPLVTRLLEPAKEAAAKPVALIKEGTKKAVDKASEKVEAVKETVKEEAEGLKDAFRGATSPPAGAPAVEAPPGLLERAGNKLADARDAVAEKVKGLTGAPEQTDPKEIRRHYEQARHKLEVDKRRYLKRLNEIKLANIAAWEAQVGQQAIAEYNAWLAQRNAEINAIMQGNAAYANQAIRRR